MTSDKVECSKCSVDYHLITKSCQKKGTVTGCSINEFIIWKDGKDQCSKCLGTHTLREGVCIAKVIFCAKQENQKGVEVCLKCDPLFQLKDGKCSQ